MSEATAVTRNPEISKAPAMGVFERYLTRVGGALHRRRDRSRSGDARRLPRHRRGDGRRGQSACRRAGLAHDHPHAAQDRPCGPRAGQGALARDRGDGRHQLAGEALLHGVARLALYLASVPALPASGPDRRLYRRIDPACGRALHGHGLRLVEPRRRRAAFHAVAGRPQRQHHGHRLRADRRPAARPLFDHRAVEHAVVVGRALHRRSGHRRATVAAHVADARREGCARQGARAGWLRCRYRRCC